MADEQKYYVQRKRAILRDFDNLAKVSRPVLIDSFPAEDISSVVAETRLEVEKLLPRLPYIGGKEPFTRFVIYSAIWLEVYRTASALGKTVPESGELFYRIGASVIHSYPPILLRLFGGNVFSASYLKGLQARAIESQKRMYPGDYVYEFVPGDGAVFDYGVDYYECATCKFLAAEGAAEVAPYLCPADILYSQTLGWGLKRTMTLAAGDTKCDFRFKRGGTTQVKVPALMKRVIEAVS